MDEKRTRFEISVISALADLDHRLSAIEIDLHAIAEAERARHHYFITATDTMRRAADAK